MFVVSGQFVEEDGYEPPQGTFRQQQQQIVTGAGSDTDDGTIETTTAAGSQLKIMQSRWILSEDPNDRKDGLWIWGLFKEPLYPFLLLQLQSDAVALPNGDSLAPLNLYAQINHKRAGDNNAAVILDSVTDLNIRQLETIQADPFGVSQVDVFEEVNIGSLSIQPVL